jgi:hypothetical protein
MDQNNNARKALELEASKFMITALKDSDEVMY